MPRNISKPFVMSLSLIDIEPLKPKYKCFFGEDVQLIISVIDENKLPVDLSEMSARVYYICDGVDLRQDENITITDAKNGVMNVLVKRNYIRVGTNDVRVVLYDEDQEIMLQPATIVCKVTNISDENPPPEDPEFDYKTEIYKVKNTANTNKINIGDINTLKTTVKSDLVSGINEIVDITSSNKSELLTNIETNTSQLLTKIETNTSQLEQKANISYVDTMIGSMGNTKTFKGSCLFSALPISATVDDYWYVTDKNSNYCWNGSSWVDIGNNVNIGKKTITTDKASFFSLTGKNLFNKNEIIMNYCLNANTGELININGGYTSDYIAVDDVFTVKRGMNSKTFGHCFYDSNKQYISGVLSTISYTNPQTISKPSNAVYVKISGRIVDLDLQQVENGEISTEYESYKELIPKELVESELDSEVITQDMLSLKYLQGAIWQGTAEIDTTNFSILFTNVNVTWDGRYNSTKVNQTLQYNITTGIENSFIKHIYYNTKTNLFEVYEYNAKIPPKTYLVYMFTLYKKKVYGTTRNITVDGIKDGGWYEKETIVSRWQGKKANFLGDSITYGYTPNSGSQMENPYPKQIGEILGLSISRNYGISSTTVATKSSDSEWNSKRNPMVLRYLNMDNDADIIGCLAGINDFWLGVPLGTFEDRNTDTFYGALHTLYSGLVKKYPAKTIFVMTCLQAKRTNPNGVTLKQWITAIKEVAEYYSIPVLDLYSTLGVNPNIQEQYDLLMPDGLHPNQILVDKMVMRIVKFIESL